MTSDERRDITELHGDTPEQVVHLSVGVCPWDGTRYRIDPVWGGECPACIEDFQSVRSMTWER